MLDNWRQNSAEFAQAENAYIKYLVGLSQIVGAEEADRFEAEAIIGHAEGLILAGLQDVIRYCNPPEKRVLLKAEHNFGQSAPIMRQMLRRVYREDIDQLTEIHPALPAYRPLPLFDERVYKFVAHSRYAKLLTAELISPFQPKNLFSLLDGRNPTAGNSPEVTS